jgi:uncharacterized protein
MANYDPSAAPSWGQTISIPQAQIDAGLKAHMLGVYNYMMIGLAITGAAALGLFMLSFNVQPTGRAIPTPLGMFLFGTWFKWVIMLAPLAFSFFFIFKQESMSATTAQTSFFIYALLIGISMTMIFAIYKPASLAKVFFITSATYAAVSLYGYTAKKSLSGMGTFMIMGLFGLMIASLVNIFLKSDALSWAISVGGVLIFAGLTAWDTQRIKDEYLHGYADKKSSIFGALSLYLNFVNMFQFMLSLLGDKE